MSSKTSTSGCAAASCSAHSRAAQAISCWLRSPSTASSTPAARPSRSATTSSSQETSSFSCASSTGSSSEIPAARLDHLGERPVGDALAVGQAAAGEHGRALEPGDELAREPALADAGLAVDREQVRAAVADGALERVLEQLELGVAPDERRRRRPDELLAVADAGRAPDRSGSATSAQLARAGGLELDRGRARAGSAPGPTRISSGRRQLLEPRRDVDGLAGREGRLGVVGDDLAGLDADPRLEAEVPDRVQDRERGAQRALGVVLVRARDAERGHDGVAGELLDRAAVRLDAARDLLEEARDTPAHDLGIARGDEARSSRRGRRRGRSRACVPCPQVYGEGRTGRGRPALSDRPAFRGAETSRRSVSGSQPRNSRRDRRAPSAPRRRAAVADGRS